MHQRKEFVKALLDEVVQGVYTFQADNTDYDRFGYPSPASRIKDRVKSLLFRSGLFVSNPLNATIYKDRFAELGASLEGLDDLYCLLSDKASRALLVKLIAYRILGKERVRLPLNNPDFWRDRQAVNSLLDPSDTINAGGDWTVRRANLAELGYPIGLYGTVGGLQNTFALKQYEYPHSDPPIKAEDGDVVIDAGGCWGDTTLYFASEVGPAGKVYSFEFMPSNLAVMRKNLALNEQLRERVEIIEKPLWESPDATLYFADNGPASRVSVSPLCDSGATISTMSIDDFVSETGVQRIDFVKMDIEGAELRALKGATRTIKTFRPKLAISIYHSLSDFVTIPRFIADLGLGYRFYLGHYTIHAEETVLFATAAK